MSNSNFELDNAVFEGLVNDLPDLSTTDISVDSSEIDAIVTKWSQDPVPIHELDDTQPVFDAQEFANWLDSIASPDLDL